MWLLDGAETSALGCSRSVQDLRALTGAHVGPVQATAHSLLALWPGFASRTVTWFGLHRSLTTTTESPSIEVPSLLCEAAIGTVELLTDLLIGNIALLVILELPLCDVEVLNFRFILVLGHIGHFHCGSLSPVP